LGLLLFIFCVVALNRKFVIFCNTFIWSKINVVFDVFITDNQMTKRCNIKAVIMLIKGEGE